MKKNEKKSPPPHTHNPANAPSFPGNPNQIHNGLFSNNTKQSLFPDGIQPNSAVHGQHTAQMAEKPAAFTAMSQTRPQPSYADAVYLTGPYNRVTLALKTSKTRSAFPGAAGGSTVNSLWNIILQGII